MATPPTFVAEYEVASWTAAGTSKTASVTVAAGDLLVVLGASEDFTKPLSTPTGGSLTYTLRQSVVISNYCTVYIWTAPCPTSQSFTITSTIPTGGEAGLDVVRLSGHGGVGASIATNLASGAPSLAVTTTGANSALLAISADWSATDGASRTWRPVNSITPTSGNGLELAYARDAAIYTVYAAYWNDTGTAGSKTVGLSVPSGQKYAIATIEILGTAGGSAFTSTVDDSAGLTDVASVASAFARVVTDTAGLADSTTATSAFSRTQNDPAGLTDTAIAATAFTRSAADDAGLTDTAVPAAGFSRSADDTTGLADSASTQLFSGFVRTVDDSAGLTDTIALARSATITDTTGLTDGVALDRAVTVTDTAGLTDSIALAQTATVTDTAGLTDTAASVLTGGGNFTRTVDDTIGLTDAAATVAAFARTQTDSAGLTDSLTQSVAGAGTRQVDDTVGLTDTVTYSSTQTVTDSAGLTDTTTSAMVAVRTVSDTLSLTDSVTSALTRSITVTDSAGLTDSVAAAVSAGTAHVRVVTDLIGLTSEYQIVHRTHRPFSGIISRPTSGMIARPRTGVISRYPFVPD